MWFHSACLALAPLKWTALWGLESGSFSARLRTLGANSVKTLQIVVCIQTCFVISRVTYDHLPSLLTELWAMITQLQKVVRLQNPAAWTCNALKLRHRHSVYECKFHIHPKTCDLQTCKCRALRSLCLLGLTTGELDLSEVSTPSAEHGSPMRPWKHFVSETTCPKEPLALQVEHARAALELAQVHSPLVHWVRHQTHQNLAGKCWNHQPLIKLCCIILIYTNWTIHTQMISYI